MCFALVYDVVWLFDVFICLDLFDLCCYLFDMSMGVCSLLYYVC